MARSHLTLEQLSADDARIARVALVGIVLGFIAVMAWIEFYDYWNGWDPRSTAELRLAAWAEADPAVSRLTWSACRDHESRADGLVPCEAAFEGLAGTYLIYCPGDESSEMMCRWR